MASHGVRFPEIRHSAKLPHAAAELKVTLQALAEMAGYGTSFAEVWPEPPLESEKTWAAKLKEAAVKFLFQGRYQLDLNDLKGIAIRVDGCHCLGG